MSATHRPLSSQVSVCGQIDAAGMGRLRAEGFTHLLNHRPDGEEPAQPSGSDLADAARAVGLIYVEAPVRGLPDPTQVEATGAVLAGLGPDDRLLMFCRSGMRSTAAWAMAMRREGKPAQELRDAAVRAGYDLSRLPL